MEGGLTMLLVEDTEDMRYLVRVVLEFADEPIDITAEAVDGTRGLEAWREKQPDITVLDLRLPDMSGLDLAEQILAEDPEAPILLFSAFLDDSSIARAARLGVRACVSKDQVRELPALIHQHSR